MNINTRREEQDHGREQAEAQARSIKAMVAALGVDYDELHSLQDSVDSLRSELEDAREELSELEVHGHQPVEERRTAMVEERRIRARIGDLESDIASELDDLLPLLNAADGCEDAEQARERIQEDALSVEVCSGWTSVGEALEPERFRIVLCTGGPHVQLVGKLDQYGEPGRAWLEYSDWFQGMQEYHGPEHDGDTFTAYAACFHFGEC